MVLKKWSKLPEEMKNEAVEVYYDILSSRKVSIFMKRIFDLVVGIATLIALLPILIIVSLLIKFDSKGPIIFKQIRVTKYGKTFDIYKFRTMVVNAEKIGTQITTKNDSRITKIGRILRKYRIDEFPQILNIIKGEMSFVGTRPEVPKYVNEYTDEMMATLLLPAGVTSLASIKYKDEEKLISNCNNADETYIKEVLPEKMKYNIDSIERFNIMTDIKVIFATLFAVVKSEDKELENINL